MRSAHGDASDLLAVIRSSGERSFEACKALLAREIPGVSIHAVEQRPFEAALRSCYRLGMESGAPWMLTLDGDVLVKGGAVMDLLREARRLPRHFVQVEGLIHDKLLGEYRNAGHRIYRTAHLPAALAVLPAPGTELRPEFETLQRLERRGFPSAQCGVVLGVHDYEQYYRDLYRKAFVHGQKHPHWLSERVPKWRALAEADRDFLVATRGFLDGFQARARAVIDAGQYGALADEALDDLGLEEKPALGHSDPTLATLEGLVAEVLSKPAGSLGAARMKFATAYRRLGPARMVAYLLGSALYHAGTHLRGMVERK
jgi:hypothetical protein